MPGDKSHPLPVDTILDGKFRVTREIGRGGMAVVYEAENVDIGKRVAVKVLAAELVSSRTVTERFIREARAAAAIRSPYICDVYDVGAFEDRPFLVMELLEGESLYDRLSRVRRLDQKATVVIATQVCKGLTKAHEANIVHRDLKPENIFLTKNEDGEVVSKIVDFGLAKFYEPTLEGGPAARLTKEGALFGTPAYMSPEQAKAQGEVDNRADLWALACIVYECLTGRTVWNVDQGVAMILAQIAGAPIPRPSRLRDDLPKTFDDWFLRALDRNPDRRYQTAKDFSDGLLFALDPPEGSVKLAPIHTAEEGEDVDRLVSGEFEAPSRPTDRPSPPSGRRDRSAPPIAFEHLAHDEIAALLPSGLPPSKSRGPGVAILFLLAASVLALGGYAAWFYLLHPAERGRVARQRMLAPDPSGSLDPSRRDLAETEPYALQIATAQERIASGQLDIAAQLLKGAFDASQNNAARSLYNHAEVIGENAPDAPCKVTALGHPRPFSGRPDASSLPTIVLSGAGLVAGWAEMDPQSRRRYAYTTVLDQQLRRVTPVLTVTPEAKLVQQPSLEALDDGLMLLYWDSSPDASGVFVRKLDASGSITSPPLPVSTSTERQSFATSTRDASGKIWVAWTEKDGARVSDLFARPLDADLKPSGRAIRLTRYTPAARIVSTASKASLAIAHGFLNVAYALERGVEHHVYALRVPLKDQTFATGGLAAPPADGSHDPDRFLGQIVPVSTGVGQPDQPSIACVEQGCFVAWDDQKNGGHVAFYSGTAGEVIWRRDLGPRAVSPTVAGSASDVAISWYDTNRLRIARLSRDGIGPITLLGHASGYQPPPDVLPGAKPGTWFVAWRDFEAGQHEAFVVRAECR